MNALDLTVGTTLPPLHTGPITRHRVAMYAHGSGDLNPIHVMGRAGQRTLDRDPLRRHAAREGQPALRRRD
jgi:acyl dehydratase